ncbi:hypothetical protein B0H14DRAFT_2798059 [Mycena olivaceomarginata]|nr:hypothetical protein B0H14DRAFT_2798059 [Mycena olivaceomarginata]
MLFHDLDEDVLAHILVSSDIYAVLSFLRVSKPFRHLALSKQLWLSLVHDLSTRYFIPNLDTVHECTSAQLIAKVRWLVCGPATWSQQSSVLPTVSFSKTFSFPETIPLRRRSRLLPGGRYFAVWEDSDLQCFEVVTGRCVWNRPLTGIHSVSWDVEILDDGASAIFVFVQFYSLTETEILSIVQVDFRTGHSEVNFHMGLNRDVAHYHSPILSGNLLAIGVRRLCDT